ncbi:MAG: hypothetical protein WCV56_06090, partial [Candidatus Omnitrophota bacterium]
MKDPARFVGKLRNAIGGFNRQPRVRKVPHTDAGLNEEMQGISTWRRRNALFIKVVCLAVSLIFLNEQIGWTQDGQPIWTSVKPSQPSYEDHPLMRNFKVPNDIAGTQEIEINGGEETVIHIQDAHASLAAQESIAGLLDSLVTDYDLRMIALEGGSGYIDTSVLKTFPNREIRDGAARHLMEEGLMSAGEFFSVTRDGTEVSLYGIEDDELYAKNLESFRKVASDRAEKIANLDLFLKELSELDEKISSAELSKLNRNAVLHRESNISFTDHWSYLGDLAGIYGEKPLRGGELEKLVSSVELEKSIDFASANRERKRLISELSEEVDKAELEELVIRSLEFKQNKISQGAFHEYLSELAEKYNKDPAPYGNLIKFTRYISLYETIDVIRLVREMNAFEDKLRERLYRGGDERKIFEVSKMAFYLKQLYSMELASEEYHYFKERTRFINAAEWAGFVREMSRKYSKPISGGYDLGLVTGGLESAMEFYEDAEARNIVMINNTISRMKREGVRTAALITGGFHTQGLTELMRQKKLSYMVIMPKFDGGKERPYVAVLTGKKGDYKAILDSGKYQLAVQLFFQHNKSDLRAPAENILPELIGESSPDQARRFFDMVISAEQSGISWKRLWADARNAAIMSDPQGEEAIGAGTALSSADFEAFLENIETRRTGSKMAVKYVAGGETKYLTIQKRSGVVSIARTHEKEQEIEEEFFSTGGPVYTPLEVPSDTGRGSDEYNEKIGLVVEAVGESGLQKDFAKLKEDITTRLRRVGLNDEAVGDVIAKLRKNKRISVAFAAEKLREDLKKMSPAERKKLNNSSIINALIGNDGPDVPAYIARLRKTSARRVDMFAKIQAIDEAGIDIYEGRGISLLLASAEKIRSNKKLIDEKNSIIEEAIDKKGIQDADARSRIAVSTVNLARSPRAIESMAEKILEDIKAAEKISRSAEPEEKAVSFAAAVPDESPADLTKLKSKDDLRNALDELNEGINEIEELAGEAERAIEKEDKPALEGIKKRMIGLAEISRKKAETMILMLDTVSRMDLSEQEKQETGEMEKELESAIMRISEPRIEKTIGTISLMEKGSAEDRYKYVEEKTKRIEENRERRTEGWEDLDRRLKTLREELSAKWPKLDPEDEKYKRSAALLKRITGAIESGKEISEDDEKEVSLLFPAEEWPKVKDKLIEYREVSRDLKGREDELNTFESDPNNILSYSEEIYGSIVSSVRDHTTAIADEIERLEKIEAALIEKVEQRHWFLRWLDPLTRWRIRRIASKIEVLNQAVTHARMEYIFGEIERAMVSAAQGEFSGNPILKDISGIDSLVKGGIPLLRERAIQLYGEVTRRALTDNEKQEIDKGLDKLFERHEKNIRDELGFALGKIPGKERGFLIDHFRLTVLEGKNIGQNTVDELAAVLSRMEDLLVDASLLDFKIEWQRYKWEHGKITEDEFNSFLESRERTQEQIETVKEELADILGKADVSILGALTPEEREVLAGKITRAFTGMSTAAKVLLMCMAATAAFGAVSELTGHGIVSGVLFPEMTGARPLLTDTADTGPALSDVTGPEAAVESILSERAVDLGMPTFGIPTQDQQAVDQEAEKPVVMGSGSVPAESDIFDRDISEYADGIEEGHIAIQKQLEEITEMSRLRELRREVMELAGQVHSHRTPEEIEKIAADLDREDLEKARDNLEKLRDAPYSQQAYLNAERNVIVRLYGPSAPAEWQGRAVITGADGSTSEVEKVASDGASGIVIEKGQAFWYEHAEDDAWHIHTVTASGGKGVVFSTRRGVSFVRPGIIDNPGIDLARYGHADKALTNIIEQHTDVAGPYYLRRYEEGGEMKAAVFSRSDPDRKVLLTADPESFGLDGSGQVTGNPVMTRRESQDFRAGRVTIARRGTMSVSLPLQQHVNPGGDIFYNRQVAHRFDAHGTALSTSCFYVYNALDSDNRSIGPGNVTFRKDHVAGTVTIERETRDKDPAKDRGYVVTTYEGDWESGGLAISSDATRIDTKKYSPNRWVMEHGYRSTENEKPVWVEDTFKWTRPDGTLRVVERNIHEYRKNGTLYPPDTVYLHRTYNAETSEWEEGNFLPYPIYPVDPDSITEGVREFLAVMDGLEGYEDVSKVLTEAEWARLFASIFESMEASRPERAPLHMKNFVKRIKQVHEAKIDPNVYLKEEFSFLKSAFEGHMHGQDSARFFYQPEHTLHFLGLALYLEGYAMIAVQGDQLPAVDEHFESVLNFLKPPRNGVQIDNAMSPSILAAYYAGLFARVERPPADLMPDLRSLKSPGVGGIKMVLRDPASAFGRRGATARQARMLKSSAKAVSEILGYPVSPGSYEGSSLAVVALRFQKENSYLGEYLDEDEMTLLAKVAAEPTRKIAHLAYTLEEQERARKISEEQARKNWNAALRQAQQENMGRRLAAAEELRRAEYVAEKDFWERRKPVMMKIRQTVAKYGFQRAKVAWSAAIERAAAGDWSNISAAEMGGAPDVSSALQGPIAKTREALANLQLSAKEQRELMGSLDEIEKYDRERMQAILEARRIYNEEMALSITPAQATGTAGRLAKQDLRIIPEQARLAFNLGLIKTVVGGLYPGRPIKQILSEVKDVEALTRKVERQVNNMLTVSVWMERYPPGPELRELIELFTRSRETLGQINALASERVIPRDGKLVRYDEDFKTPFVDITWDAENEEWHEHGLIEEGGKFFRSGVVIVKSADRKTSIKKITGVGSEKQHKQVEYFDEFDKMGRVTKATVKGVMNGEEVTVEERDVFYHDNGARSIDSMFHMPSEIFEEALEAGLFPGLKGKAREYSIKKMFSDNWHRWDKVLEESRKLQKFRKKAEQVSDEKKVAEPVSTRAAPTGAVPMGFHQLLPGLLFGAGDEADVRELPAPRAERLNREDLLRMKKMAGCNYRGPQGNRSYGTLYFNPWIRGGGNGIAGVEWDMDKMAENGLMAIRTGLVEDGRPLLDDKAGVIPGRVERFIEQVRKFLNIAGQKRAFLGKTKNLQAIDVQYYLIDGTGIAKPAERDEKNVTLGGRAALFQKANRDAFIQDFLAPFLKGLGDRPSFQTLEIINEPEHLVMDYGIEQEDVDDFIRACARAVREHAPHILVTVGVNTQSDPEELLPYVKLFQEGTIDYLDIHHYEDRFRDDWQTLKNNFEWLNDQGVPWGLGEHGTAEDMDANTLEDYLELVKKFGGISKHFWNFNPGIDDRTANARRLDRMLKALRPRLEELVLDEEPVEADEPVKVEEPAEVAEPAKVEEPIEEPIEVKPVAPDDEVLPLPSNMEEMRKLSEEGKMRVETLPNGLPAFIYENGQLSIYGYDNVDRPAKMYVASPDVTAEVSGKARYLWIEYDVTSGQKMDTAPSGEQVWMPEITKQVETGSRIGLAMAGGHVVPSGKEGQPYSTVGFSDDGMYRYTRYLHPGSPKSLREIEKPDGTLTDVAFKAYAAFPAYIAAELNPENLVIRDGKAIFTGEELRFSEYRWPHIDGTEFIEKDDLMRKETYFFDWNIYVSHGKLVMFAMKDAGGVISRFGYDDPLDPKLIFREQGNSIFVSNANAPDKVLWEVDGITIEKGKASGTMRIKYHFAENEKGEIYTGHGPASPEVASGAVGLGDVFVSPKEKGRFFEQRQVRNVTVESGEIFVAEGEKEETIAVYLNEVVEIEDEHGGTMKMPRVVRETKSVEGKVIVKVFTYWDEYPLRKQQQKIYSGTVNEANLKEVYTYDREERLIRSEKEGTVSEYFYFDSGIIVVYKTPDKEQSIFLPIAEGKFDFSEPIIVRAGRHTEESGFGAESEGDIVFYVSAEAAKKHDKVEGPETIKSRIWGFYAILEMMLDKEEYARAKQEMMDLLMLSYSQQIQKAFILKQDTGDITLQIKEGLQNNINGDMQKLIDFIKTGGKRLARPGSTDIEGKIKFFLDEAGEKMFGVSLYEGDPAFTEKSLDLFQRLIAESIRAHDEVVRQEMDAPGDEIRAFRSSVFARCAYYGLDLISKILANGREKIDIPVEEFKGQPGIVLRADEELEGMNVVAEGDVREMKIPLGPGALHDLSRKTLLLPTRPLRNYRGELIIQAVDNRGRKRRLIVEMPHRDAIYLHRFAPGSGDPKYLDDEGFDARKVTEVKVLFSGGRKNIIFRNLHFLVKAEEDHRVTGARSLDAEVFPLLREPAPLRHPSARLKEKAGIMQVGVSYDTRIDPETGTPLDLKGKELTVNGTLSVPVNKEGIPVSIVLIDGKGERVESEVVMTGPGGSYSVTVIPVSEDGEFDPSKVKEMEVRWVISAEPPSLEHIIMLFGGISLLWAFLFFATIFKKFLDFRMDISAMRPRYGLLKQLGMFFGEMAGAWRELREERSRRARETAEKIKGLPERLREIRSRKRAVEPVPVKDDRAGSATPETIVPEAEGEDLQGLYVVSKNYAKELRGWYDRMHVDFRRKGSQEEDEDLFLATLRKTEPTESFDQRPAPRYNIMPVYKSAALILLGVMVGFSPFPELLNLLPYISLGLFVWSINWRKSVEYGAGALFAGTVQYVLSGGIADISIHSSCVAAFAVMAFYISRVVIAYLNAARYPDIYRYNQYEKLEELKAKILEIQANEDFMKFAGPLTRWKRTRASTLGVFEPAGKEERTKMFSIIIEEAIKEIEDIQKEIDDLGKTGKIDMMPEYKKAAGVPVLIVLSGFVIGAVTFSLIPGIISLAAGLFVFVITVVESVRKQMLIYPVFDMKKIMSDNFRMIYTVKGRKELRATDIWRFTVELAAAAKQKQQALAQKKEGVTVREKLNEVRHKLVTLRWGGRARGPIDSRDLSMAEDVLIKVKMLGRISTWFAVFGLVSYVAQIVGIVILRISFNVLSGRGLMSYNELFEKGFGVFEILALLNVTQLILLGSVLAVTIAAVMMRNYLPKAYHKGGWQIAALYITSAAAGIAYIFSEQDLLGQVLSLAGISAGQFFFGGMVLFALGLTLNKFGFYKFGTMAKLYPWQKTVRVRDYFKHGSITGVSLFLLVFLSRYNLFQGPVAAVAGIVLTILLVNSAITLFMMPIASRRYKAIAVDDHLYEGPNEEERAISLKKFENAFEDYFDRNFDQRGAIIKAHKMKKTYGDDWRKHMFQEEIRNFELVAGKGQEPSSDVEYDAVENGVTLSQVTESVYNSLSKKQLFERMSGAAFESMKAYYGIEDDVKLFQVWETPEKVNLTADGIRRFLAQDPTAYKVVKYFDFLQMKDPWIVSVLVGAEVHTMDNLMDALISSTYPLKKRQLLFATENWNIDLFEHVVDKVESGEYPPDVVFAGMPVREDNVPEAKYRSLVDRILKRGMGEPAQPYTKPGANLGALYLSVGSSGIIYDSENIPNPNQPLQFLLGTMLGISAVDELRKDHLEEAIDEVLGSENERERKNTEISKYQKLIGRITNKYNRSLTSADKELSSRFNIKRGSILKRHMRWFSKHTLPKLFELAEQDERYFMPGFLWEKYTSLGYSTGEKDAYKSKEAREIYDVWLTMYLMPDYGKNLTLYFNREISRDEFIKRLIVGYFREINEPKNGQGRLAKINSALQRSGIKREAGDFQRWEPGQNAAYMFGEYAGWYTAGWDGFMASQDTFKPLGGTTGYFCTERGSEVFWEQLNESAKKRLAKDRPFKEYHPAMREIFNEITGMNTKQFTAEELKRKLLAAIKNRGFDREDLLYLTRKIEAIDTEKLATGEHFRDKAMYECRGTVDILFYHNKYQNKLLALGAWDEMQVAEDYMLGMVAWWHGLNIAAFYSLTPEDPAGFEAELSFKYRPKQISRWIKGYIIGPLKVTEPGNMWELYERKGLWGLYVFLVPSLGSALLPLIFKAARIMLLFWSLYFVPLDTIGAEIMGSSFAPLAVWFEANTQFGAALVALKSAVSIFIPTFLNFMPTGWAWAIGPGIVFAAMILHRYYTLRGIFKGVNDYLGLERILDEYGKMALKEFKQNIGDTFLAQDFLLSEKDPLLYELMSALKINVENNRRNILDVDITNIIEQQLKVITAHVMEHGIEGVDERGKLDLITSLGVIEELILRKRVVGTGDIRFLTHNVPGLLYHHKYLLGASLSVMGVLALILVPGSIFSVMGFAMWAGVTALSTFLFWSFLLFLARMYVNSGGTQEERAVRGIRVRTAAANFFIDYYHSIYILGCEIAWQEVIDGGRVGYWWRTPRSVDPEDEIRSRLRVEVANERKARELARKGWKTVYSTPLVSSFFSEKLSSGRGEAWTLEEDLSGVRLNIQLILNYGFMVYMSLVVALGLRFDARNNIFAKYFDVLLWDSQDKMPWLVEVIKANPEAAFIAVIGLMAVFAGIFIFRSVRSWRIPDLEMEWMNVTGIDGYLTALDSKFDNELREMREKREMITPETVWEELAEGEKNVFIKETISLLWDEGDGPAKAEEREEVRRNAKKFAFIDRLKKRSEEFTREVTESKFAKSPEFLSLTKIIKKVRGSDFEGRGDVPVILYAYGMLDNMNARKYRGISLDVLAFKARRIAKKTEQGQEDEDLMWEELYDMEKHSLLERNFYNEESAKKELSARVKLYMEGDAAAGKIHMDGHDDTSGLLSKLAYPFRRFIGPGMAGFAVFMIWPEAAFGGEGVLGLIRGASEWLLPGSGMIFPGMINAGIVLTVLSAGVIAFWAYKRYFPASSTRFAPVKVNTIETGTRPILSAELDSLMEQIARKEGLLAAIDLAQQKLDIRSLPEGTTFTPELMDDSLNYVFRAIDDINSKKEIGDKWGQDIPFEGKVELYVSEHIPYNSVRVEIPDGAGGTITAVVLNKSFFDYVETLYSRDDVLVNALIGSRGDVPAAELTMDEKNDLTNYIKDSVMLIMAERLFHEIFHAEDEFEQIIRDIDFHWVTFINADNRVDVYGGAGYAGDNVKRYSDLSGKLGLADTAKEFFSVSGEDREMAEGNLYWLCLSAIMQNNVINREIPRNFRSGEYFKGIHSAARVLSAEEKDFKTGVAGEDVTSRRRSFMVETGRMVSDVLIFEGNFEKLNAVKDLRILPKTQNVLDVLKLEIKEMKNRDENRESLFTKRGFDDITEDGIKDLDEESRILMRNIARERQVLVEKLARYEGWLREVEFIHERAVRDAEAETLVRAEAEKRAAERDEPVVYPEITNKQVTDAYIKKIDNIRGLLIGEMSALENKAYEIITEERKLGPGEARKLDGRRRGYIK